jgi:HNH endonuclease
LLHKNWKGYGTESVKCVDGVIRKKKAHRMAWERKYGPIPEGMEPDHTCRNRGCVNTDHMELVTNLDNLRRAGKVKLTAEMVMVMKILRAAGETYTGLGLRFGVRADHVQDIFQGKCWKGV